MHSFWCKRYIICRWWSERIGAFAKHSMSVQVMRGSTLLDAMRGFSSSTLLLYPLAYRSAQSKCSWCASGIWPSVRLDMQSKCRHTRTKQAQAFEISRCRCRYLLCRCARARSYTLPRVQHNVVSWCHLDAGAHVLDGWMCLLCDSR